MYKTGSANFAGSLKRVLPLILTSRVLLTICGFVSTRYFLFFNPRPLYLRPTGVPWLDIWGYADTGWYLNIAQYGYSSTPIDWMGNQANIGFFPLYPQLIHLLAIVVKNEFVAGLLVSNFMLIVGCCYLYMLAQRFLSIGAPIKVIAWFLAIPGAFMLSAGLSESTLFCLSVISFYYAYNDEWPKAGFFGALSALTKPTGVIIIVPLLVLYLKRHGFARLQRASFLLLIPFGAFCFGIYCYLWHNDFFAYVHSKHLGWHTRPSLPWTVLYGGLRSSDSIVFWNSVYTGILIALLIIGIRKVPVELWLFCCAQIIFPLVNGEVNLVCMFRYTIILFPIAIILYCLKLPKFAKIFLATLLIIIQIVFMISFSNCMEFVF